MTVQDMQARVAFLIDDNSGKNYSPSDLTAALNVGQDNVAKEFVNLGVGWFEQAADLNPTGNPPGTIPGQELYALPTDFVKFIRVERTDTGLPMTPINMNDKVISGTTNPTITSGFAVYNYYITGQYMGVNPIPTTAIPIRLWYSYLLPRLILITDVCQIQANWHDMVCVSAAWDFVGKDAGITGTLEKQWNRYMMQLHQTEGSRQIQSPRGVTQTHASYGY